ncbi:putative bifunctional diguanylate cyclase/phosphodiesterase [Dechloromonas denitrificans]|uniref:putative bifunctional diguanylate cyclase/phosphodiesterase n=1 Tax=Dechloromonas denitrificans TaxID=281362 RepID=UPI001CF9563C|nr:EAL domain-containing protein [Dechloromonas denitrificans]UCV09070.1 EAL domain-containing protein [Dechloromonas denitrificans]
MKQRPALCGNKIVLVMLAAISLVWLLIGLDLWALHLRPSGATASLSGSETEGDVAAKMLPLLVAGFLLSVLAVFGGRFVFRMLRQMLEQLHLQRMIIDHTSEAMMVTDLAQRILTVSPAFEQITGYPAAEVIGRTPLMLSSDRHGPEFYQAIWARVAETGQWEGETWDRRKDGQIYPKQMRIRAVREGRQQRVSHYVAVFSDISAHKAQEARIDYLAHHDPLTSLPNRLALDIHLADVLGAAARSASRVAVIIIDLDHFKTVNDSLGHHAGDLLLGEIARRLQAILEVGSRLFRLGGDEFVVVLEEANQAETVVELVHQIERAFTEPCQVNDHLLHTSPSIGISLYPIDGETAETLIRNADTAMYYAKSNGRNNYQFFAEPMNAAANKRLHLETELWDALAQNQLLLHYQPQIDLPSGNIVGVEALVRWQHPVRGMIGPGEFIPVAEECGLILPLGHWVLLTACRQAKAWIDAGVDIGEIAVNISALQFRQPEFAQSVHAILLETGLPPERLELEITESTVMHSADSSIKTLAELKRMGVKLAIDDFGTGYSSLAYLRRFPIDRLKIDRAFVADVESDTDAASLVSSIISLGRSLGLHLVAEGVENSAQADFLRALDCQRVQGFHFFRPVVAEEVAAVSEIIRLARGAA